MTSIAVSNAILWVLMLGVIIALWALARQVGILYERVAPMGALMTDAGPKLGEASPSFDLASLGGGNIAIGGGRSKSQLIFFLSPTCPVCKKLLPILKSASQAGTTRAGSVGPNREKLTGRSRRPISLAIAALPKSMPDPRVIAPPRARPTASRRRRGSKALPNRLAAPRPLNRLVPARASSHG